MPTSAAYSLARARSRPATALTMPPAAATAGTNALRAIRAVPMIPQRTSPVPGMYLLTLSSGPPGPSPPGPLAPAPAAAAHHRRPGGTVPAGTPRRAGDANVAWVYQCADGPE